MTTPAAQIDAARTSARPLAHEAGGVDVPVPGHEDLSADEVTAVPSNPTFFRPDVEGLRAVAVMLVLLYHANIGGVTGGFVGVDVFFVVSGFLITSLLVREADGGHPPSLRNFYARRVRRLLPAAFVVTVATVLASYRWLGFLRADQVAEDGRWSAAFMANWHYAHVGTDYLTSLDSPSPFQHFWSLAVEEQFYLVWPGLVVLACLVGRRFPVRTRLGALLIPICVVSLLWSVRQTDSNGTVAFFSSFTRAWELGIGALLAVSVTALRRVPAVAGAIAMWIGLGLIVLSAFVFDNRTEFPGTSALVPVGGTLLVLLGGSLPHRWNANVVLARSPLQGIGRISYGLYLWHWPIIVIVAEYHGEPQSPLVNGMLLIATLAISLVSYWLVEGPLRYSKPLVRRPWMSIAFGLMLVAASLALTSWTISRHGGI